MKTFIKQHIEAIKTICFCSVMLLVATVVAALIAIFWDANTQVQAIIGSIAMVELGVLISTGLTLMIYD